MRANRNTVYCCILNLSISLKEIVIYQKSTSRVFNVYMSNAIFKSLLVGLWFALISLTHVFFVHGFIASIATSFLRNEQCIKMDSIVTNLTVNATKYEESFYSGAALRVYDIWSNCLTQKGFMQSKVLNGGEVWRQARNCSLFVGAPLLYTLLEIWFICENAVSLYICS